MKNSKGFTMIEIVAIIVILSLIMMIVYPVVSDVLFKSKTVIDKLALKNIKESAELLAEEIYVCDDSSYIIDLLRDDLGYLSVTNCKTAKEELKQEITITIELLKDREYITRADKCEGNIILKLNGEEMTDITVDVDNVTCTK